MTDEEIEQERARRAATHDGVAGEVRADVENEIESHAARPVPGEPARAAALAADMRRKAMRDVAREGRELERVHVAARISQVVDYAFGVVYVCLGLRFLLAAMAARSTPFLRVLYDLTDPLYAPFRGILATPSIGEDHRLVLSLVFAIVVYLLVHLGVHQLLRVLARPREAI